MQKKVRAPAHTPAYMSRMSFLATVAAVMLAYAPRDSTTSNTAGKRDQGGGDKTATSSTTRPQSTRNIP